MSVATAVLPLRQVVALTLDGFHRATRGVEGHERAAAFDALPESEQAAVWSNLERACAESHERQRRDPIPATLEWFGGRLLERGPERGPQRRPKPLIATNGHRAAPGRAGGDDVLLSVAPADYVEWLGGIEVSRSGKLSCPFHDDRTPSLHVYGDHWHCFSCSAHGDIYTFAAALWGYPIPLRGTAFLAVRERLLEQLALGAA